MSVKPLALLWLFLLTAAFSAHAAPRELWVKEIGKVTSPEWVGQIVADKSGGVAVTYTELTNGGDGARLSAVWLNSSGKEIHRKTYEIPDTNGMSFTLRILAATRAGLVIFFHTDGTQSTKETVVISRAGAESEVDEVTTVESLLNGEAPNDFHDANGFFGFRVDADSGSVSVVRRSYR
jgi:hypothetical protein